MADKPEALRLANLIDHGNDSSWIEREAAAELRRLHAVNQELLEALQDLCDTLGECGMTERARAAIAKAEGEKV